MGIYSKEILLGLGVGAATLITATTLYRYKKQKNQIPEKWVEVGTVGDLWIYPLKSGRAIEVEQTECTEIGPVILQKHKLPLKDRCLLVYTEKDREYRTARNYPKMVLISVTAISEHEITLDAPDMSPVIINISIENPELISCTLGYGEPHQCIDCGDEVAKWISQYCCKNDSGLRLGICGDWKRSVTIEPWKKFTGVYDKLKSEDLGIYTDMATYMICNEATLEDLNQKLPFDLSMLYFRPNITVVGPKAFVEDDWDWIKIGEDVIFRNVRPCTRCMLVNLDPETGVPVPDQAVLKKLKEYRLVTDNKRRRVEGNSPVMGVYAGIRKTGQIKLGDKVYVG